MQFAKRAATGCLIFLLIACTTTAVIGLIWQQTIRALVEPIWLVLADPTYTELNTSEQMAAYVLAEPEATALVAYTADEQGNVLADDTAVFRNADRPMPLASTAKIVILTAVAQAVADGHRTWQDPIPLADWDRYYLPGTDGGAHPSALANLEIATDAQGFALDGQQTVTLDDLTWAMIRYSDNAATDYLLATLPPNAIERVFETANLGSHDPLPSFLGLFLLWNNHETPTLSDERVAELVALEPSARAAQAQILADRYTQDEAWRTAEQTWRANRQPNRISHEMTLATQTMPRASARDYAHLLALIATDNYASPAISADVRRFLEWPMVEFPSNIDRFAALGTKGGTLAGVLTEATYYVPQAGDFAGETRIVVLFQADPPFAAWLTQLETFAQQTFMADIATDAAWADQLKRAE
ncbi:MAG: serine hydrolase [Anaerolineales bacterium]|nr:serine hydrolase [Anaerolineales bacterium]